jgi:hypothetical protein
MRNQIKLKVADKKIHFQTFPQKFIQASNSNLMKQSVFRRKLKALFAELMTKICREE